MGPLRSGEIGFRGILKVILRCQRLRRRQSEQKRMAQPPRWMSWSTRLSPRSPPFAVPAPPKPTRREKSKAFKIGTRTTDCPRRSPGVKLELHT
ncbi:hypothetical protein MRX96_051747 [Rhipicephalus microplus]